MFEMGGSLRLPAAMFLRAAPSGGSRSSPYPVSEIRRSCSGSCHLETPGPWKFDNLAAARNVLTMGDR
jgi:hypothetical protein